MYSLRVGPSLRMRTPQTALAPPLVLASFPRPLIQFHPRLFSPATSFWVFVLSAKELVVREPFLHLALELTE